MRLPGSGRTVWEGRAPSPWALASSAGRGVGAAFGVGRERPSKSPSLAHAHSAPEQALRAPAHSLRVSQHGGGSSLGGRVEDRVGMGVGEEMTGFLCPRKVGKGHPHGRSTAWACKSGEPSEVRVLPPLEGDHGRRLVQEAGEQGRGGAAWKAGWAPRTVLPPRARMEFRRGSPCRSGLCDTLPCCPLPVCSHDSVD